MSKSREIRNSFDRVRTPTIIEGPSLTKQSFCEECDINVLMARYTKAGALPVPLTPGEFLDVSAGVSFHEALNIVKASQDAFMRVPAPIREMFGNDPGEFVAFLENPANDDKAVELGLKVRPVSESSPVPIKDDSAGS